MPTMFARLMKGLAGYPMPWGLNYSAGIDTLAAALRKNIPGIDVKVYGWTESDKIEAEIMQMPATAPLLLGGHSMGANYSAILAAGLRVRRPAKTVDYVCAFDPTVWWSCPSLESNVKRALCIHGINAFSFVGHKKLTKGATFKGRLDVIDAPDLHENIDDNPAYINRAVKDVREILGV